MKFFNCFDMAVVFFLLAFVGCQPLQTATISASMKANLTTNVSSYQLKIHKIILCDGYEKYLALGEISKLPKEEVKGQVLEDTVTFVGPVKPIQYFLILNKQVQQELQKHLGPHSYQVVESEEEIRASKPLPPTQVGGTTPISEQERTSVGDCKIYFIRQ